MNIITTNTDREIIDTNVPDLPEGVATSGYMYNEEELDSPETLEAVESIITSQINENSIPPMNHAQKRALAKKMGKKSREQLGTIGEAAKKLDYIDLIQKLRELNKKKENIENETVTKNR